MADTIDKTCVTYRQERLVVDVYPNFLNSILAQQLFDYLETEVPWNKKITPGRRVNQNYGEVGLKYVLKFGGYNGRPAKTSERPVLPWSELPALEYLLEMLLEATGSRYNYCVIQRYPSGQVGINPHKDKEMQVGSLIAGLSLGTERTLTLTPPHYNRIDTTPLEIKLPPGSLYVLKDPTNRHWQHAIEKDDTTTPRISLTFRTM